ncbi:MAG: LUD domain-containing protein [Firmicutes bacterium]|nr:LUD domain-containing protein [Bacillota bacterium]
MNTERAWFWSRLAERTVEALRDRQIEASYRPGLEEAREYILSRIPEGATVGYGGSRTLVELGLIEALRQRKVELLDRGRSDLPAATRSDYERRALTADIFLSGINALSADGRLGFIDCYGNRVAPILFGPARVLLVAGANKIEPDLSAALYRAKEVAAPMNAYRLARRTPCTQSGRCHDCRHEGRICSYTVIIDRAPRPGRLEVVLVGEALGL